MPYYQDTNNQLHYLSDADIANGGVDLLPTGCVAITDTEATALQAAKGAALLPNPEGFAQAIKTALCGIVGANALAVPYPLFFAAVQLSDWEGVQALIEDAQAEAVVNAAQYAAIKAAALANNIPVTLP